VICGTFDCWLRVSTYPQMGDSKISAVAEGGATIEPADVAEMMRNVKGVVAAGVAFGPYDAVAIVEASDLNTLGRKIVREIRSLLGVLDTITCLAVDPAR
jgi:DNA-binding Lrp family transcriptional regulator